MELSVHDNVPWIRKSRSVSPPSRGHVYSGKKKTHTVKNNMIVPLWKRRVEYLGHTHRFEYHDWMMNMEPAAIRLQEHIVLNGDNLGEMNPCPIEYRSIFIKEIKSSE
jgi:hypothetical protein